MPNSKYRYNGHRIWLYCPGCKEYHFIDSKWDIKYNDGIISVNPSFLLKSIKRKPDVRCHFFLRNNIIEYLNDCTHEYKGKKISIVEDKNLDA